MSAAKVGKRPVNWESASAKAWAATRRESVTYSGIHEWMKRTYGQPSTCEGCGRTGLSGRFINWANVSGEYKRDRADWKRLCRPCHFKLDRAGGSNFFGGRNLPPQEPAHG